MRRCGWAEGDPLLAAYHDEEWGVAPADDAGHFGLLSLELFQAGLSWRTILHKREGLRRAFCGFDPRRVAAMTDADVAALMADAGIVRHRRKILATIHNARVVLRLAEEHGSFTGFVARLPAAPAEAARVLRRAGFRHLGPTVVRSYLEACGLIPPPHEPGCWRAGDQPHGSGG